MKATCIAMEVVQLDNKDSVYRCKFQTEVATQTDIPNPVLALDQYWISGTVNVYTKKANYKVGNAYEISLDVKG